MLLFVVSVLSLAVAAGFYFELRWAEEDTQRLREQLALERQRNLELLRRHDKLTEVVGRYHHSQANSPTRQLT